MRLYSLFMLSAALAAGDASATASTTAASDPKPPVVTFTPSQVKIDKTISFDGPQHPTSQTSCSVRLKLSSAQRLYAVKSRMSFNDPDPVHIDEATTDAGESLMRDTVRSNLWDSSFSNRNNQQSEFNLDISDLRAPLKPCKTIATLSGYITVRVSDMAPRKVIFKLSEVNGKSVPVEGLPGIEVTIERRKDEVSIVGPSVFFDGEITFLDAAGQELSSPSYNMTSNGNQTNATYHPRMPADGTVVATYQQGLREIRVPFALKDIAVEAPEAPPVKPRMYSPRKFKKSTETPPVEAPPPAKPEKPSDF